MEKKKKEKKDEWPCKYTVFLGKLNAPCFLKLEFRY